MKHTAHASPSTALAALIEFVCNNYESISHVTVSYDTKQNRIIEFSSSGRRYRATKHNSRKTVDIELVSEVPNAQVRIS